MNKTEDTDLAAGAGPLTYAASGVSIEAQDEAIARFKSKVEATFQGSGGRVLAGVGSFGAAFEPDLSSLDGPVLVFSTDGIGTKVRLHARFGTHAWAGRDLVSATMNDVICLGARPLVFLDYLACNRLDPEVVQQVVGDGMAAVCGEIGCALIGGELAEMGSTYQSGEYDLAGFAVGMVDRDKAWGSQRVSAGSVLVGIASSGAHCNGFSLLRRIFEERSDAEWLEHNAELGGSLRDVLLRPTLSYARLTNALGAGAGADPHGLRGTVQAAAHISGGGLPDNLPRIMPDGLCAEVAWDQVEALAEQAGVQSLFATIRRSARIEDHEFARVLNMGVGFVLALPPEHSAAVPALAQELGFTAAPVGVVRRSQAGERFAWRDNA